VPTARIGPSTVRVSWPGSTRVRPSPPSASAQPEPAGPAPRETGQTRHPPRNSLRARLRASQAEPATRLGTVRARRPVSARVRPSPPPGAPVQSEPRPGAASPGPAPLESGRAHCLPRNSPSPPARHGLRLNRVWSKGHRARHPPRHNPNPSARHNASQAKPAACFGPGTVLVSRSGAESAQVRPSPPPAPAQSQPAGQAPLELGRAHRPPQHSPSQLARLRTIQAEPAGGPPPAPAQPKPAGPAPLESGRARHPPRHSPSPPGPSTAAAWINLRYMQC
jgi:hypothetical protein